MEATLYSIPGSHPAKAVGGMLDLKGIPYKRRDLMPVISKGVLKGMRFPGTTIPSLRVDGRKLTGSREISRALDEIKADPLLFPSDPTARAAVEEAEVWGEKVLSDAVRRILWNAIKRNRKPLKSFAEGAKLGVPIDLAVATAAPIIAAEIRIHKITDERVREDLAAFPGWLDQVDEWISEGVLGGDPPNAADFQIAAALRLAMTLDDLRPVIESRPAGELALRLVPDYPGKMPPVLPSEWLTGLRAPAAAAPPA
jgi:glutathione S-transferase